MNQEIQGQAVCWQSDGYCILGSERHIAGQFLRKGEQQEAVYSAMVESLQAAIRRQPGLLAKDVCSPIITLIHTQLLQFGNSCNTFSGEIWTSTIQS